LHHIAEAAARLHSAQDDSFALHLAGIDISSRHIQRIAAEIGGELAEQRDDKADLYRRRELPVRVASVPEVVAVEVDGGHLRTRATGCGPGVHEHKNNESKVACLVTLHSETHEQDPQPQPPESFVEPRRVQQLVQQMQGSAGELPAEEAAPTDAATPGPPDEAAKEPVDKPRRHVRTCVASMADSHSFGPMVAAEAQERGFYSSQRSAFVGDGAAYNWWIHRAFFPHFIPITDFLHVLCYIYLAAWAVAANAEHRWRIYVDWLVACWQGGVNKVIDEMRRWQEKIGVVAEGEEVDDKDPRKLLAEALTFLENNKERMDYPLYRQLGLPITSSLVESLVGEFNARLKSKQQYWNRPDGAEPILQLRAAVLSDDDRLDRFFDQRPGNPFRRSKAA